MQVWKMSGKHLTEKYFSSPRHCSASAAVFSRVLWLNPADRSAPHSCSLPPPSGIEKRTRKRVKIVGWDEDHLTGQKKKKKKKKKGNINNTQNEGCTAQFSPPAAWCTGRSQAELLSPPLPGQLSQFYCPAGHHMASLGQLSWFCHLTSPCVPSAPCCQSNERSWKVLDLM